MGNPKISKESELRKRKKRTESNFKYRSSEKGKILDKLPQMKRRTEHSTGEREYQKKQAKRRERDKKRRKFEAKYAKSQ